MEQQHQQKQQEMCYSTIKKLVDNEFSYISKESTRQELYQQIFRHKTNLRRENHNLKIQIQQTKESILSKALGTYINELKQLSVQNQTLRDKHKLIHFSKKPTVAIVQYQSTKSPLLTPRSKRSIAFIYDKDNNSSKFNPNRQSLKQQRPKNIGANKSMQNQWKQGCQNIKPINMFGRSSLKINEFPKRNEPLTERKIINPFNQNQKPNNHHRTNNISIDEINSIRGSLRNISEHQEKKNNQNIFMKLINTMLQQEKIKQKQICQILEFNSKNQYKNKEEIYVNVLENQIIQTTENIQKIQNILSSYEQQIKQIQVNLSSVTDMNKQLSKVKQHYLIMQQKCKNIEVLKFQVIEKQRRLKNIKQDAKLDYFDPPNSIKMLLRLLGVEQQSMNDPSKCKQQVKNLIKGVLQKPNKKKIKVKELLDTIREGRNKFKQLMEVYETRIKKWEKKLVNEKMVRFNSNKPAEQ